MPRSTTRERIEATARRRLDDRQIGSGRPSSCQYATPADRIGSAGVGLP